MPPPPLAPKTPPAPPQWHVPKLKLRVDDLAHAGAAVFFAAVQPAAVLRRAVDASMRWLYPPGKAPTQCVSPPLNERRMRSDS